MKSGGYNGSKGFDNGNSEGRRLIRTESGEILLTNWKKKEKEGAVGSESTYKRSGGVGKRIAP